MERVKAEGTENLGTGHCSGKLRHLSQDFWVPVLRCAGPWFAEVLSSGQRSQVTGADLAGSRGV